MRLFLGMPVPGHDALREVTQSASSMRGFGCVADGSWHVTLRFLGEVGEVGVVQTAMDDAMFAAIAVRARIEGVGAFPDVHRARVLWAGIDAPELPALVARIAAATHGVGMTPSQDHRPHVSLGRCRRPTDVSRWAKEHAETEFADGLLDLVVLYKSELSRDGAKHTAIDTWRLPS